VKSENAIPVFCSYTIGIELDRKRQRAIKFTECALPPMNADPFGVGDCLSAGDADRVFLRLNLKAVLVDSGQLDDRQDVIPLLKRIDWGKRSLAGSLIVEPTLRRAGTTPGSDCRRPASTQMSFRECRKIASIYEKFSGFIRGIPA
jgi:hypothetical protein